MSQNQTQLQERVQVETLPPVIDVPHWLMAEQPTLKRSPALLKKLTDETYSNFFETVLDRICTGMTFRDILQEDGRNIDPGKMMSWIKRDPQREQRYYDAQEVGMEMVSDEIIGIADATDNPMEDVQRSSLRIEARMKLLKTRHKRRYGDSKQLDISQQVISSDHLTSLASRLVALKQNNSGVYSPDIVDVG